MNIRCFSFVIRHVSFFWFDCDRFQPLQVKCLKKEDPNCFVLRSRDVFLQVFDAQPCVSYHFLTFLVPSSDA